MSLEGHVDIVLPRDPDNPVQVALKEPANVSRLLSGRTAAEVIRIVPSLFSLCGTAHAAAAAAALESAAGRVADRDTMALRECLVLMERVREHLLRIALDWPLLASEAPDIKTAQSAMSLLSELRNALDPEDVVFLDPKAKAGDRDTGRTLVASAVAIAESRIFQEELSAWRNRRDQTSLGTWAASGKTVAARLLGALLAFDAKWPGTGAPQFLNDFEMIEPVEKADFVPETSPLERRRDHPLLACGREPTLATRYLARLVDLSETLKELQDLFAENHRFLISRRRKCPRGVGFAETARGRLTHVAKLRDGMVEDYRIISPTRWNFADRGVASRCLGMLSGGSDEERIERAGLVIGAIDPCVRHTVRIH
ncbi:nickel-dependent hydrogenase large subunit [Roseibium sp. Sym1]|uniref:nickel-dependent hydrogenase large subunit n=1 Tax=Roseibium sp. Sym1 TaxID=3016006 RepID=UPI0022B44081|nr:nickel-dependent hydrogenase large subunit [Roseibium sp. Sym1]